MATGSAAGGRCTRWLAKLALASIVLVAYDVDHNDAGDKAAAWWLDVLPNAKRWRPLWRDVNDMAVSGADHAPGCKWALERGHEHSQSSVQGPVHQRMSDPGN